MSGSERPFDGDSVFDALTATATPERTIGVVSPDTPEEAIAHSMLTGLFEETAVSVATHDDSPANVDEVVVTDGENQVLATSSLTALERTLLQANSDLYLTGDGHLTDVSVPAAVEELADIPFELRGYPKADKEKLLLIVISRYIERHAWQADSGTLHAGFQYLSRLGNEEGTRRVYKALSDSGVDLHVYGVPDWDPPASFEATVHASRTKEIRQSWFVTYLPGASNGDLMAMGAVETDANEWLGLWSFDPDRVRRLTAYIQQTFW